MRAYELQGKGLKTLTLVERPSPQPGPTQILVRLHAASLNYRDLLIATDRYGRTKINYPLVPLSDGAGEVVAVGSNVTRMAIGDRVIGNFFQKWSDGPFDSEKGASALGGAIDGVLAEQVLLEEAATVRVPETLSLEEAATLPCAGLTAWVGLVEFGGLKAGETVLAMGTGGVSIFALQIAKSLGARVILTSSSDVKLSRGRELGADATVNYRHAQDWDGRVRELTDGRGVDHLLEVGGAGTLPISLRAVRQGGHLSLVGLLSGTPGDREQAAKNDRGIRVDSVYVGSTRMLRDFSEFLEKSALHPVIDRVFAFEETPAAYEHLQSGSHFGKIVIRT